MKVNTVLTQKGFKAGYSLFAGVESGQVIPEYNRRKELYIKAQDTFKTAKTVLLIDSADVLVLLAAMLAMQRKATDLGLIIIPLPVAAIEPVIINAFRQWKPGAWLVDLLTDDKIFSWESISITYRESAPDELYFKGDEFEQVVFFENLGLTEKQSALLKMIITGLYKEKVTLELAKLMNRQRLTAAEARQKQYDKAKAENISNLLKSINQAISRALNTDYKAGTPFFRHSGKLAIGNSFAKLTFIKQAEESRKTVEFSENYHY